MLLWGGSHRTSHEEMDTIDLDFLSSTGVHSDYALIHHPCWVQINPAHYCLCSVDCLFDFIKVDEGKKQQHSLPQLKCTQAEVTYWYLCSHFLHTVYIQMLGLVWFSHLWVNNRRISHSFDSALNILKLIWRECKCKHLFFFNRSTP